jgi:hypothetical protein
MSHENPNQDPRRSARIVLSAEIKLRRAGQSGYRVKIHNVSPEGCKAEFVERPQLDERVWVKFQGLEALGAIVCWVRDLEVGLEFENRIHPTVFALLVSKFTK